MPLIAELDELSVVGFLDVIGTHSLEYVAEQAELTIDLASRGCRARAIQLESRLSCSQRHGYTCCRPEQNQGSFAHHLEPSALRLRPTAGPATYPSEPTGSGTWANTIGMLCVWLSNGSIVEAEAARITSGASATSSAAH